ncbi:MAG: deoxyribodipyrimidine photolyase [Gemmatimonadetes bacterium]|uniref:Deoxyribodipyrimidine photolyase n=1 Tax=Candidatus Kutchimonas denitrificans TaxID=3056748 RepID=A0AAE4ZBG7_9BACT|nr:deoxyribodipyrimidine photolyase [Gemmatimonadota bacterium]NIR74425.1 deoxyribodipyrimidine photolyase [Candidatus Kutchimonas denitrificans]NIS00821.1 deoxyribodipyrimidine photolyase [Gemmatimonadota bacterium]NIT66444.1 deoxyribodipyrimidine photolyase [Gemmatimonadota bacterium]NIU52075.1 deoxyribodipyrimidine photolyase [Gemmatimonadota bacterium]
MSVFTRRLADRQPDPEGRRWLYVAYDQLTDRIGPLSREEPEELGIVLIESSWKAGRRPYHKQKLAAVLANQRQFALEQAERGVAVRYVATGRPYRNMLAELAAELGPLRAMEPAERELRVALTPLAEAGLLDLVPHEGWLTTASDFEASQGDGPPYRMDAFYRQVRREYDILMEDGKPRGGKYSFDAENRESWNGEPAAPEPPRFPNDEIKEEVGALIDEHFDRHPGVLNLEAVPTSREDAGRLWDWAKSECMEDFGPYEDAMSTRSRGLFHTRISTLLNLHRLLPQQVMEDVASLDAPLASVEGFIRQVLGWREFVRHVHRCTDGLRSLPEMAVEVAETPGDGGYARWRGAAWDASKTRDGLDGGATPSFLGSDAPLPVAYWGAPSGLSCLDHVVSDVWATGYGHHITRLMVLSNIATLIDTSPRELTDWFWCAYTDAYDWVVEPNVLGMGTFAVGDLMTTKPYVSGSNYIDRMSDYCDGCAFDPKKNCPIANLYWAFLERRRDALEDNPRLRLPLASAKKRSTAKKKRDRATFEWVKETLAKGERLRPDEAPTED